MKASDDEGLAEGSMKDSELFAEKDSARSRFVDDSKISRERRKSPVQQIKVRSAILRSKERFKVEKLTKPIFSKVFYKDTAKTIQAIEKTEEEILLAISENYENEHIGQVVCRNHDEDLSIFRCNEFSSLAELAGHINKTNYDVNADTIIAAVDKGPPDLVSQIQDETSSIFTKDNDATKTISDLQRCVTNEMSRNNRDAGMPMPLLTTVPAKICLKPSEITGTGFSQDIDFDAMSQFDIPNPVHPVLFEKEPAADSPVKFAVPEITLSTSKFSFAIDNNSKQLNSLSISGTNNMTVLEGFKTGSGRKVTISDEALAAAKSRLLLSECLPDNDQPKESPKDSAHDFLIRCDFNRKKLNSKELGINSSENSNSPGNEYLATEKTSMQSDSELQVAELDKHFASTDCPFENSTMNLPQASGCGNTSAMKSEHTGHFVGFTTGLGVKVNISEQAMAAAKARLESDIADLQCQLLAEPSEITAAFNVSSLMKPIAQENVTLENPVLDSDSKLQVSKLPLAVIMDPEHYDQDLPLSKVEASKKNSETHISEAYVNVEDVKPERPTKVFEGFKTGLGSKVIISESALAAGKARLVGADFPIFEDLQSDDMTGIKVESSNFVGFTTGSGTKIKISDVALREAKSFLERSDSPTSAASLIEFDLNVGASNNKQDVMNRKPDEPFVGFMTGSGVKVKISEKSLAAGRSRLLSPVSVEPVTSDWKVNETVDFLENNTKSFVGFTTGSGVRIKLSEESLAAANARLNEMEADDCAWIDAGGNVEANKSTINAPTEHRKVDHPASPSDIPMSPSNDSKNNRTDLSKGAEVVGETKHEHYSMLESGEISVVHTRDARQDIIAVRKDATQSGCDLSNSFSALLDNTDWSDDFPLEHEEGEIMHDPSLLDSQSITRRLKRASRNQTCLAPAVLQERQIARTEQISMKKNKKVTQKSGSLFCIKSSGEHLLSWRELLKAGPRNSKLSTLRKFKVRFLDVNANNASSFMFDAAEYFSDAETNTNGFNVGDGFVLIFDDNNRAGFSEFERSFLAGPGIDPLLVPDNWVRHHYGLIVWKYACYQRTCVRNFDWLTPHNVMLQLKYRYDREVDRSESSALKRIVQKDDSPAKPLVLCVINISKSANGYCMSVTDGWYICNALIDFGVAAAVNAGRLDVGTKILSIGAELVCPGDGCHPLEISPNTYLKLSSNSVRRTRWFTKLGYMKLPALPSVTIESLIMCGGNVARLDVVIVRKYPLVYMEKTKDGTRVVRNEKSEMKAAAMYQDEMERVGEKLRSQIMREMTSDLKKSKKSFKLTPSKFISNIDDPVELSLLTDNSQDPTLIQSLLTPHQRQIIADHREKLAFAANREFSQRFKESLGKRNVSCVLRVKLLDYKVGKKPAVLSWWRPDPSLVADFEEGRVMSIFNVATGSTKSSTVTYLNSTSRSRIELHPVSPHLPMPRKWLMPSDISMDFQATLDELDIMGLVIYVQNSPQAESKSQTVYLADSKITHLIGIKFAGGLAELGFKDIFNEGVLVYVRNVYWLPTANNLPIPVGYGNEYTTVSLKGDHTKFENMDLNAIWKQSRQFLLKVLSKCNIDVPIPSVNVVDSPRPQYHNAFAQQPTASSTPRARPRKRPRLV